MLDVVAVTGIPEPTRVIVCTPRVVKVPDAENVIPFTAGEVVML
jgi:hypothetical protein